MNFWLRLMLEMENSVLDHAPALRKQLGHNNNGTMIKSPNELQIHCSKSNDRAAHATSTGFCPFRIDPLLAHCTLTVQVGRPTYTVHVQSPLRMDSTTLVLQ